MLSVSLNHGLTPSSSSIMNFFKLFKGKDDHTSPIIEIPDIVVTHVDVPIFPESISSSFSITSAPTAVHRRTSTSSSSEFNVRAPFASSSYLAPQSLGCSVQNIRPTPTLSPYKQVPLRRTLAEGGFPSMKSVVSLSKITAHVERSPSINNAIFVVGEDHEDQDAQPASTKSLIPESCSVVSPPSRPSQSWMPYLGYIAQTVKKIDFRMKFAQFSGNLTTTLSDRWMDLKAASSEEDEYDISLDDTNKPWHEILADLEREMDPFSKHI